MQEHEQESVIDTLARLWPGKFQSAELIDFAARLAPFDLSRVLSELDRFKSSKAFPPKVSEILAKVAPPGWGKRVVENQHGNQKTAGNIAEAVRSFGRHGLAPAEVLRMTDLEIVVRHYRACWLGAKRRETYLTGMRNELRHSLASVRCTDEAAFNEAHPMIFAADNSPEEFDAWLPTFLTKWDTGEVTDG